VIIDDVFGRLQKSFWPLWWKNERARVRRKVVVGKQRKGQTGNQTVGGGHRAAEVGGGGGSGSGRTNKVVGGP